MSLLYNIKKKFLTFFGDIKWEGICHPFWFVFNAHGYQLRGKHYRAVKKIIKPGDILIRRFEGYVDKFAIPGYFNHAGIYVGDEMVVHAIAEGVIKEDIIDFMRTDHLMILRPAGVKNKIKAVEQANALIGSPYDFDFNFEKCDRFSCTELICFLYPNVAKPKRRASALWKKVVVADDIVASKRLKKIWSSLD